MRHMKLIPAFQRNRNWAVKRIKKNQEVYMHWGSTDCDGVYAGGCEKMNTIQDIIDADKWADDSYEWCDGPFNMYYSESKQD